MPVMSKISSKITDPVTLNCMSLEFLDVRDIVSIVFLMCNDPNWALSILRKNLEISKPTKILADLFATLSHLNHLHLKIKFIECLVIIQNFQCLRNLGYNSTEINTLKKMFSSSVQNSCICAVRKALFHVCEGLDMKEMAHLVDLIDKNFEQQKSCVEDLQSKYLEIKFLYLIREEYSCEESSEYFILQNLIKILQSMKKYDLVKELEDVINSEESHVDFIQTDNESNHLICQSSTIPDIQSLNDNYLMDENNIGLCLIINQKDFSRANHSRIQLDFRYGSDSDRDMLQITFTVLGYKVIVLENKESIELQKDVRTIIKTEIKSEHSSFVLCVLSHGSEGSIYGVDGHEVPIQSIKHWILGVECPQLLGKPKILIIQACQGKKNQKVIHALEDASTIENDGPATYRPSRSLAPMSDLITFNSTVPGYTTFRSVESGSFFVQTLCTQLLNYPLAEIQEVFLKVNRILSEKPILNFITTSNVDHTLTKKIVYPVKKKNKTRGAIMLYEKYFLNALINHCILQVIGIKMFMRKKANEMKRCNETADNAE